MRNQEKHVEQTQAFVRTGIQPDINLATVMTALANAKVQLVTRAKQLRGGRGAALPGDGRLRQRDYALSDEQIPPITGEEAIPRSLVARAEKNRPEIANLIDAAARAAS